VEVGGVEVSAWLVWNVSEKRLELGNSLFPSQADAEAQIAKLARGEQRGQPDRLVAVAVKT
jgi:hypothetical protein